MRFSVVVTTWRLCWLVGILAQYQKPYNLIYVNQGPVTYRGRMTQIKGHLEFKDQVIR